jgi:hypothetical protein
MTRLDTNAAAAARQPKCRNRLFPLPAGWIQGSSRDSLINPEIHPITGPREIRYSNHLCDCATIKSQIAIRVLFDANLPL